MECSSVFGDILMDTIVGGDLDDLIILGSN